jgi:hypothetical protein
VKNGNERQKEDIPQNSVASTSLPEAKHFEQNLIGGVRCVAVAAAGTQVRAEGGSGRITGQQRVGQRNACVLFLATRFAQSALQMDFQFAEKTTASGTISHDQPPGWQPIGLPHWLRASVSQRMVSFLSAAGMGPAVALGGDEGLKIISSRV